MVAARLDLQHGRTTLFFCAGEIERPKMQLEIYEVGGANKAAIWKTFRKYHYLNTDLHQAARQFVGIINGELVCHTGIIQFPIRKGWKRVHRLVVLPDYQGIGIGTTFIQRVAEIITSEGHRLNLTTTTPALVKALTKNRHWALVRYGRCKNGYASGTKSIRSKHIADSKSDNRITYSFNYVDNHQK